MTLLDQNISTIIATPTKQNWKQKWIHSVGPSWELKDQQGNLLGKFTIEHEKGKSPSLYNSDGSILITLHTIGYLEPGFDISDSDGNLLAKIRKGSGQIRKTKYLMENSKGEEVLTTDPSHTYGSQNFRDKNNKTVAELNFNKLELKRLFSGEGPSTIKIYDLQFERILILAFVVSWFMLRTGVGYNP